MFTPDNDTVLPDLGNRTYPIIQEITITQPNVEKLLTDLNPHKAISPDSISTRFLKECAKDISSALTLIFQASLNQGTVPDDWKKAIVTQIFKKVDRSSASNYRLSSSHNYKLCLQQGHATYPTHSDNAPLRQVWHRSPLPTWIQEEEVLRDTAHPNATESCCKPWWGGADRRHSWKSLSRTNTLHLPPSLQAYHRLVFWDLCYSLSSSTTCHRRPSLHAVCLLAIVIYTRG